MFIFPCFPVPPKHNTRVLDLFGIDILLTLSSCRLNKQSVADLRMSYAR